MPEGLDLGLSGLASGFDWRTLVDQLTDLERSPQRRLLSEQQAIQQRKTAYASIATQLGVLQNRIEALNDPALFDARTGVTSNEDRAIVSAQTGAALGTYAFNITQLATAALRRGSSNIASPLSATSDVSGVAMANAPFATAAKPGTITVNGEQINIYTATTTTPPVTADTLQSVFDKISVATDGDVTASYDPLTDRITLSSASNSDIVLGSATDTSNFLQLARLSNNGSDTVTSSSSLGSVRLSTTLSTSNLATAATDGGTGAGKFKINGVEISFSATADSVSDVLKRINDSTAGVSATYDSVNDRFLITSKATGDIGIALEDVTGNFLAATGLLGSSLQRGNDLIFTVNGGGQLSSHSNTITEDSSGIEGLSVTALDSGTVTLTVGTDAAAIKKAITGFIDEYNKVQAIIDTNTASTTDAKGKVTAGTLAGESDAYTLSSELRRLVTPSFSFLTGTVKRLESIGIDTNGNNDNLALTDSAKLDQMLASNLVEVQSLFTANTTNAKGLAVLMQDYLDKTIGDDGSLVTKQDNLDKQSNGINDQIASQERLVQDNRARLIASFVAMETAQQRSNQQLQYLSRISSSQ